MKANPTAKRAALLLAWLSSTVQAQGTGGDTPKPPPTSPPGQQVDVTGGRESDADQRRQSTAAKIVIGREEIERFGDSTVGEVLKRLPGVTMPGAPGRGGPPRMRGLGAGYTQLLIDGQRVPPGFSLESLTPDQIERIEILRAPTAETGARAIGGTINIITREAYKRRLNDLRLGFSVENGEITPGLFWTRNDSVGDLIYNVSAGMFRNRRVNDSSTETVDEDLASGEALRVQRETSHAQDRRIGLNVTTRLQWRLSPTETLILNPVLFANRSEGSRRYELTQSLGADPLRYDHAASDVDGHFAVLRLSGQWRKALGSGARFELGGHGSMSRGAGTTAREEFDPAGAPLRSTYEDSRTRDRSLTLNGKLSKLLDNEHSLVSGAELETVRRTETRTSLQDGTPVLAEFGDDVQASSLRLALYAQDEWNLSPNWAAHAGLRWEGIRTQGDTGDGTQPRNRSSVVTPLLHAVWKPDPQTRDQLRLSLTRSYKSPTLQNLVARPSISSRYAASGPNAPTSPDRAGNPALQPELATGIDIALERYLKDGGVLSANLFHRRLKDYIRSVTALETVSYSPVPRYVSRPQNIGGATTQGLELEAKFRLDQALDGAPPVEIRSNLSLFRSRVDAVPGPDNRLDQQPRGTANLGADYRLRGTPLTLGGSLNFTPAYRTQVSETEAVQIGRKRQFDAYALWVFTPSAQLRALASNMAPNDYVTGRSVETELDLRERTRTVAQTATNWQLRLELKL